MGKHKVYVYTICKNEITFVRRWMESMSEADGVFVLDTGSTDGTPRALEDLGAVVPGAPGGSLAVRHSPEPGFGHGAGGRGDMRERGSGRGAAARLEGEAGEILEPRHRPASVPVYLELYPGWPGGRGVLDR